MGYDVIGDIHGQAGKLEALLRRMGYARRAGRWIPPSGRQAVFLGDLIDRGPDQVKVVNLVRAMIDAGDAHSVMGNHEFNAIGYVTPRPEEPGAFLRRHTNRNVSQHEEFIRQVGAGSDLHRNLVRWFRTPCRRFWIWRMSHRGIPHLVHRIILRGSINSLRFLETTL